VTTTTGTKHDAEQIAAELVERRLAACVQIGGPIRSTYHWQGAVETSEEWLCTMKTSRPHLAGIREVLEQLHPYDLPELVATPIVDGSDAYLAWLREELRNRS